MATVEGTETKQHYLDTVAGFVASTGYDDLPEKVREHAKHVWMDTVGVVLAGSLEAEASALGQRLRDEGGRATILSPGFPRSNAINAALVNGTAGTFLELDEGHHPTGHPAIYVVPAVLAQGEATGATGKQLIEALVLGYEVTARISQATRFVKGVHTHGCLGVVGAAVGAARLMGRDASRIREAINVASCLNGATPFMAAFEGALVRNVYAGFSAHMGVLISDLVESGFTGPRDGLSETYGKIIGESFDPGRVVEGLGEEYQITSNYFKMHAACRHLHAPLDALEAALKGRVLRPEEVDGVTVTGNSNTVMCGRADPQNSLAAKFSVPFGIATGIARGSTWTDAFQQEAVDDPAARALARRVKVVEAADASRHGPHDHPARVEIRLTSGETLTGQVDRAIGDPSDPFSYEVVKDKFTRLTSATFPRGNVSRAMELFMRLEEMPRASDLTGALRELAA